MAGSRRTRLLGLFSLCAALAHPAVGRTAATEPAAEVSSGHSVKAVLSRGVEAIASFYAKRFHGRRTSSGELHRPEAFTAAHPDLPLGTRVRVIHLGNLREIIVTINDRCRRRKTPVIDLSRAAANEIGLLKQGRARVLIVPLPEASPSEA